MCFSNRRAVRKVSQARIIGQRLPRSTYGDDEAAWFTKRILCRSSLDGVATAQNCIVESNSLDTPKLFFRLLEPPALASNFTNEVHPMSIRNRTLQPFRIGSPN